MHIAFTAVCQLPYWLMWHPSYIFQFISLERADPLASSFCYLVIKQFGSLMAGKPKRMSQIKQLRLYQSGGGIKTIARILGMSKNTVKSYLKKMVDGGFNTEELLKQEDPLLEKSFCKYPIFPTAGIGLF